MSNLFGGIIKNIATRVVMDNTSPVQRDVVKEIIERATKNTK